MEKQDPGGGGPSSSAYVLQGVERTFRVNTSANTFTAIANLTAMSVAYGVVFTWTILAKTLDTDGAAAAATQQTGWVDEVCGTDHVQDFRSERDQGPSQVLYNYGVITVGTADQSITDEVRVRMDQLNEPGTFTAITACWNRLVAAGAPADG